MVIFVPPQDVEGVELWFRVSVSPEDIISTVDALLRGSVPGHSEEGMEWFSENMTQIGGDQMVAEQAGHGKEHRTTRGTGLRLPDFDIPPRR